MYRELFKAVDQGATVLTGSDRLARSLAESFTAFQRDKGRSVWETPSILSLGGYLHRCWSDLTLQDAEPVPMLLSSAQELAIWESVIRDSPAGQGLLRVLETAERAMDAWKLVHAYRLPFQRNEFSASDDCEAFFDWASEFERRRKVQGWLESARLSDVVGDSISDGIIPRPLSLFLAGFDDVTPQQRALFDILGAVVDRNHVERDSSAATECFRDTEDEIRNAAAWARERLQKNASALIGIVVPNLAQLRSKIERIFLAEMHPGASFQPIQTAFHISLGAPLAQHSIVHAALLTLDLTAGALPLERMGMLLRSPYLQGAREEQSARAGLDTKLRRRAPPVVSIEQVKDFAETCPILHRALGDFQQEIGGGTGEQPASLWSRTFSRLLKVAGWPGDRTLSSREYQTMEAWNGLLSTLASLDAVVGRMSLGSALDRLRKLAASVSFQGEDEGAPVQIIGLLEASGLRFDHLCVMGLHDGAMPPPAQPNPFLPLALQRQHRLPHSSADRELEFNTKLMKRLGQAAPEVVFSYPQWEGDQGLGASPLLPSTQVEFRAFAPKARSWIDSIRSAAASESLDDSTASELPMNSEQRGGTYVLRDMAACAFRAFAKYRLNARPLDEADLGLSALERGTAVHKALELIWRELKTHHALCSRSSRELQALVDRCVGIALRDSKSLGRSLEQWRLERLLTEWLELEKGRPPFTVVGFEDELAITIGGLKIETRIDRVDELPDGRRVILDYKTGVLKTSAWSSERPDEPQVPLYCAHSVCTTAAAAFAKVRKGDLQLIGVSDNGELGKLRPMKVEKGARVSELIEDWRRVVEKLANDFRTGQAQVNPKSRSTCEYCGLTALCRVRDVQVAEEADD